VFSDDESTTVEDGIEIEASASLFVGALLIVLSSLFFLVLSELVLSFYLFERYYVWPPNFERSFNPPPEVIHGISFPSRFTISPDGFRGDPMSKEAEYRLLAIGGSTTICTYLDDSKTWPYLLQQNLNAALGPDRVWVGNAGRPGHSTRQNTLQVEKLLGQHPEIDGVILILGANDLMVALPDTISQPVVFDDDPNGMLRRSFAVFPDSAVDSPWYARNVIGRFARLRSWHPLPLQKDGVFALDEKGEFVRVMRSYRKSASRIIPTLPDISDFVAIYVRNLHTIVDHVERMGRRVIFVTQPMLWKDQMSQSELDLLAFGGPNFFRMGHGKPFYSTAALAKAMAIYNDALLEVCRSREVECVDMAAMLPRTAQVHYDEAHYTEFGSAIVARRMAEYLLGSKPLSELR